MIDGARIAEAQAQPLGAEFPPQGEWTFDDWLRLPGDGNKYEVIDGVLHVTAAPRPRHQRVGGRISFAFRTYVEPRGLGEVFDAPIDVLLPNQPVPFEPDLLFIRAERLGMIGEERIEGAPDLVVEVISPTSWRYDREDKFGVYERAGIPEYWIADPRDRSVEVFVLEAGAYSLLGRFAPGAVVRSRVLAGLELRVDDVYRGF